MFGMSWINKSLLIGTTLVMVGTVVFLKAKQGSWGKSLDEKSGTGGIKSEALSRNHVSNTARQSFNQGAWEAFGAALDVCDVGEKQKRYYQLLVSTLEKMTEVRSPPWRSLKAEGKSKEEGRDILEQHAEEWIDYFRYFFDHHAPMPGKAIPEVGKKELYEPSGQRLKLKKAFKEHQQTIHDLLQVLGIMEEERQKTSGPVILVTPGAHGTRLPKRLSIIEQWQRYHKASDCLAWFVVTGDRTMKEHEHEVLQKTTHHSLSQEDIRKYARNENDYWPWRVRQLLMPDALFHRLSTLPMPQFLTPKIFPWVHAIQPPRATTKDNAVALAKALLDMNLEENVSVLIAVEAPFDQRMPMIFEKILKMHGVHNPVIAYHGGADLKSTLGETQILDAMGLSASDVYFISLNQMYMNLVERLNLNQLARKLN